MVERAEGHGGELALRRAGADFEIISNGVFLMDTRNGESERLLVRTAVQWLASPAAAAGAGDASAEGAGGGAGPGGLRVLVGGLGVGFSLAEAVRLPEVAAVTVVEREPAVIAWHDTFLRPYSEGALEDPRVSVACADLVAWLERAPGTEGADGADPVSSGAGGAFDVVCLDIDNGPEWTVTPGNARLYGEAGLALVGRRLAPGGVLAVWSAGAAPVFEELLRTRFERVGAVPVEVPRGEPDVVYLASLPRP